MAKAPNWNGSDSEGRKRGEQPGLDIEKFRLGDFRISQFSEKWNFSTKYPVSPRCKRCPFGVTQSSRFCGAVAKVLNGPPGEYDRKVET